MSWNSDSNANKYKKTYFNGFVDVNGGDMINRNNNIILGCGVTGPLGITGQNGIFRTTTQTTCQNNEYVTKSYVTSNLLAGLTGQSNTFTSKLITNAGIDNNGSFIRSYKDIIAIDSKLISSASSGTTISMYSLGANNYLDSGTYPLTIIATNTVNMNNLNIFMKYII